MSAAPGTPCLLYTSRCVKETDLAYGKEGVTLEQVRAAARAAKIDRFIEALPQGYDLSLIHI